MAAAFVSAILGGSFGYLMLKEVQLHEIASRASTVSHIDAVTSSMKSCFEPSCATGQCPRQQRQQTKTEIQIVDTPEFEISNVIKSGWNRTMDVVSAELLPLTDPARAPEKIRGDVTKIANALSEVQDKAVSYLTDNKKQ
eukprot:c47467_g1_i1.p1 GENE.c47467_g1_i1~~c47467_g1_i1.p1  ORF type:complete len:154 (+),score=31.65 c47467_g1_i1:45-464(+)